MVGIRRGAGLTEIEQKTLDFLRSHVKAHGFPPSYGEIKVVIGLRSKSRVAGIIDELCRRRLIAKGDHRWRSIKILQTDDYHLPDCLCQKCGAARYLAALKLIQAVQVPAEFAAGIRFSGIRPLSNLARLRSRQADPITRTSKAASPQRGAV